MKIVVIYGSPRKGVSYEAVQIVKKELQNQGDVQFTEFHLPQDMPNFCKGCFSCFQKGEAKCPDNWYIQPILMAMSSADGFIISTPVYALQISGGLKAFFDHMAFCFLNHRPRFFRQKAFIISTTAGAGTGSCNRYIKKNLSFWGNRKIYAMGGAMQAIDWNEVPASIKYKTTRDLKRIARRFGRDVKSGKVYAPSLLQTMMFYISRLIISSYGHTIPDQEYWQQQGWLDKKLRYFYQPAKPSFMNRVIARVVVFVFKKMLLVKPGVG